MEAVTAADRLRGLCFLLAVPTAVFGIAQLATLVKLAIDFSALSGHSWIEMFWRWGWPAHLIWIALILAGIAGALLAFRPRPRLWENRYGDRGGPNGCGLGRVNP